MSKPIIHANSSVRQFGGSAEDYLPLHECMDSSKATVPDNRHRAILHSSFGIFLLDRIFGQNLPELDTLARKHNLSEDVVNDILAWHKSSAILGGQIINSDGKRVSVRDVGEQHVLEDFAHKFIPTPQDYLQEMEFMDWMQNGKGHPPSHAKLAARRKTKTQQAQERYKQCLVD